MPSTFMTLPTLLTSFLLLTPLTSALDTWYTPPSSTPIGSGFNSTSPYNTNKIKGVNLGGWLILENWMTPSLFGVAGLPGVGDAETVMDEWRWCDWLGIEQCGRVLEQHWSTFYTEDDFKRMADYGLNTVRIPVPYWIWNKTDSEPFVTQKQIPHLQRALNWSSMYGMDVVLDLHALPQSQSSFQVHTGLYAQEGFHTDPVNMERGLDALGQMVSEFTKPMYDGVVKAIELVNEPWVEAYVAGNMPWDTLAEFMTRGYDVVRQSEHIPEGGHPIAVVVHDAFRPLSDWTGYWFNAEAGGPGSNWTNYMLDSHIYQAWSGIGDDYGHIASACGTKEYLEEAQKTVPVIIGEFSLGVQTFCVDYKDCFNLSLSDALNNVTSSDGNRDLFNRAFWEAQMNAYEHTAGWIFWNWKTELAPTWSYEQSVAQKWIPVDTDDRVWQYDPTQDYCLQNQNWSNVPDFPQGPADIAPGHMAAINAPLNLDNFAAVGGVTTGGAKATGTKAASSVGPSATPAPSSAPVVVAPAGTKAATTGSETASASASATSTGAASSDLAIRSVGWIWAAPILVLGFGF